MTARPTTATRPNRAGAADRAVASSAALSSERFAAPRGRQGVRLATLRSARPSRVALLPGWPLFVFFGAFPLWWIAGFGVLGMMVAAVPMAYNLLRRRDIRVPPGFALWLFFLVWVTAGVTVLWVQPSGTAPVGGVDRLLPFGFALCWHLIATIVLLYVGNFSRSELPDHLLHRLLGWMLLLTVIGGYVGYFAPAVELRSLLEIVLPGPLRGIDFLGLLIHPELAQVQDIGINVTRPAAPYVYANDWGANFGLLLPFFLLAWTGPLSGWRRRAFPVLAVLAIPPIVFSLNRGLWLGLIVAAAFVALRLATQGRLGALANVTVAAVVLSGLIVATPLGDLVTARLDNQHSNEGRTELALRAVTTALEESPVLGFGGSREIAGNFFSIAGGDSPLCPGCAPPNVGTQGHVWLLIFGHGVGGVLLFLGFLGRRLLAGLRDPSREATAMCAVVVFYLTVMFVYDLLLLPTVFLMVTLALLWRREAEGADERTTERVAARVGSFATPVGHP